MHKESLSLSHQGLLAPLLLSCKVLLSEYSFANAYLFRSVHRFNLIRAEELLLEGSMREGSSYLMPTRPPDTVWINRCLPLLPADSCFYPIPDAWLPVFDSNSFSWRSYRRQSDYIYAADNMAAMAGRHLSSKRNLIKQFFDSYRVHYEPLSIANSEAALQLISTWEQQHNKKESIDEAQVCKEAIALQQQLGLLGLLLYADGAAVGIAIGEPLTEEIFAIHFAKALHSYKGAYQYLFQLTAEQVCSLWQPQGKWINLEQDLGIPTLARAKESYQPTMLATKWHVFPKKTA